MLAIYRRHQAPCEHRSRRFRNCRCPLWVQGSLGGAYLRRSLDLRSWEAATDLVRGWESSGHVGVIRPERISISDAVAKFLEDGKARGLTAETLRKYQNLLERRFVDWCKARHLSDLDRVNVDVLREFRATWTDSPNYATKNLERIRAFFKFCEQADWIARNPALGVKPPKVRQSPTLPFSEKEMARILRSCDAYPGNRERMRAFVLTMRYSGPRVLHETDERAIRRSSRCPQTRRSFAGLPRGCFDETNAG